MNRAPNDVVISLRLPRALSDYYRNKAAGDNKAVGALMRQALERDELEAAEMVPLWVAPDIYGAVIQNFGEQYQPALERLLRFYFAEVRE